MHRATAERVGIFLIILITPTENKAARQQTQRNFKESPTDAELSGEHYSSQILIFFRPHQHRINETFAKIFCSASNRSVLSPSSTTTRPRR